MKKNIAAVISYLQGKIDSSSILHDNDVLETYARDETSDLCFLPDLVIRAHTVSDVQTILSACYRESVHVTVRGAGTGVTGGSVPVTGGIVLSLEKMNRILEIDTDNMVAVVEPGAVTGEIQKAVQSFGLLYPPDPASLESCSIGGNIAENAGGPRAVKYGTTKDYVLGLEFILPDGTLLKTGGKTVKNATGYNLSGIILGSEGTLAVVTKIFLKLLPLPPIIRDLLIPCTSLDHAMSTVFSILKSRIVPATIEFMEEDAIRLVSSYLEGTVPYNNARAHLLIQIDGNSTESVNHELAMLMDAVDVDPETIYVAQSPRQSERLWEARRSIRDALRSESPVFLAEDTVVPRSQITDFISGLKSHLSSLNFRSIMFGHAGDGNVHIDVLKDSLPYDEWLERLPAIKEHIYRSAVSLGGTITGEHGIGYIRREYLPLALSDGEIELSKKIKAAFDPRMILNPDKIFKR